MAGLTAPRADPKMRSFCPTYIQNISHGLYEEILLRICDQCKAGSRPFKIGFSAVVNLDLSLVYFKNGDNFISQINISEWDTLEE